MMSPSEQIRKAANEALEKSGVGARRFESQHGLSQWALRGLLDAKRRQVPSVDRAAEIAKALGLEFYIGPKRDSIPNEEAPPNWVRVMREDMASLGSNILSRLPEPSIRVAEDPAPYDSAGPIRLSDDAEVSYTGTEKFLPAPYARDVHAAAGQGEVVFEEAAPFRFAFPRSILPKWVHPDSLLCIRTKGDSMEPTLNDGDLILLDYSRTDPLDGQIFVLRTSDGLAVKRLRGSGLHWELASDNPAHQPRHVDQNVRVIGRVAWSGPIIGRAAIV